MFVVNSDLLHLLLDALSNANNFIQSGLGQIADTLLGSLHIRFHSLHQFLHLLVRLFNTTLEFVFQLFRFGTGIRSGGLLELSGGLAQFFRDLSDDIVDFSLMGLDLKA